MKKTGEFYCKTLEKYQKAVIARSNSDVAISTSKYILRSLSRVLRGTSCNDIIEDILLRSYCIQGIVVFFSIFLLPMGVYAATPVKSPPKAVPLEISGWIPYWRMATGTADALAHLDTFKEINPFGYTVKKNGSLFDALHIDSPSWQTLMNAARAKKIRVIPTVMWSNTDAIHTVLKSKKLRTAHIKEIVAVVKKHKFDGIDIDYEGKKAETRPYFSAFLRELYAAMGKKWVMCTIEARTPLHDRFDVIPEKIEFANDYNAINRYCDRVRIMAYDQQAIDLRLNEMAPGPYAPVADPKWVEKVIILAAKIIAKKKIVIGVPTYGYEYHVTPLIYGYRYDRLWAFNPRYGVELAQQYGIQPERNLAGELSFQYVVGSTGVASVQTPDPIPLNPELASVLAAQGPETSHATSSVTNNFSEASTTPFRLAWWSDGPAIKDKIDLAKKLGLRGIAIFKIDGGEDPAMWDVLKALK